MSDEIEDHVIYEDYVRVPRWLWNKILRKYDDYDRLKAERDEYFQQLWENLNKGLDLNHAIKFANALSDFEERIREEERTRKSDR